MSQSHCLWWSGRIHPIVVRGGLAAEATMEGPTEQPRRNDSSQPNGARASGHASVSSVLGPPSSDNDASSASVNPYRCCPCGPACSVKGTRTSWRGRWWHARWRVSGAMGGKQVRDEAVPRGLERIWVTLYPLSCAHPVPQWLLLSAGLTFLGLPRQRWARTGKYDGRQTVAGGDDVKQRILRRNR